MTSTGALLERSTSLAVEEVETSAGLERLRPEWSALWQRCGSATPFQSPEWLIPWWSHVGEGELWTLALRSGGRLVGLAPLYVHTRPGTSLRELFLLGIGTTDYLGALFDAGREETAAAALFAHLDRHRDRWDVCDLQQLRPGSPLLDGAIPDGWSEERWTQEPCPVLTLPAKRETLDRVLPALPRRKLRYYWRRAEREGRMWVESAHPGNVGELFEELRRLHGARWAARGGPGVLADERVERAHRESLPQLLALGALRFYALCLNGRIIAGFYGLADVYGPERRVYCYIGGFDPAFSHLGPGAVLIGHAIAEAVRDEMAAVDFLRGREPYKYVWGAQDTYTYRRLLRHGAA